MRLARTGILLFGLASVLPACVSREDFTRKFGKREELSDVRSRFGFSEGYWGGQGGGVTGDDRDRLAEEFADKGWKVDEKGSIKAINKDGSEKGDLFSGDSKEGKKTFGKREARLKNKELTREVYRTPEYLDRQQFSGKKPARDGILASRESDFDANRAREAGDTAREAGGESPGILAGLNPFRSKSAREEGETYRTSSNREGTRALENAAHPNPGGMPKDGNLRRAALTMDDVKKMLSPQSFD